MVSYESCYWCFRVQGLPKRHGVFNKFGHWVHKENVVYRRDVALCPVHRVRVRCRRRSKN